MPDATLTVLGCNSGMPGVRASSGYLIQHQDSSILLDCGNGVAASCVRYGIDFRKLDHVVITHTHPDHVSDLPLLVQYLHLAGKKSDIEVYLPSEFAAIFGYLIRAMYVMPERFEFAVKTHGFEEGEIIHSPFRVEAIANNHLRKYESDIRRYELPNMMQSFSLRVTAGDTVLFYSGDLESLGEVSSRIDGCAVCLLETSHVGIAEIKEFALSHPTTHMILTHLSGENAANILAAEFEGLANVRVAEDGMRIELTPTMPQEP